MNARFCLLLEDAIFFFFCFLFGQIYTVRDSDFGNTRGLNPQAGGTSTADIIRVPILARGARGAL